MPEEAPREPNPQDPVAVPAADTAHKVEKPDDAMALLTNRYSAADAERSSYADKWTRWRKIMQVEQEIPSGRKGLNNVFDPVLLDIKEVQVPMLMAAFFSEKPIFPLQPFGDEDREAAKHMEDFLQGQVDEAGLNPDTNLWVEMDAALGNWIGLGSLIAQISWNSKEKMPILEAGDLQDYLPDPQAIKGKAMRYMIRVRTVTRAWVERQVEDGVYDADAVKEFFDAKKNTDSPNPAAESADRTVQNPPDPSTQGAVEDHKRHDQTVTLTEYTEPNRWIHALGEREKVVMDRQSPYNLKEIPIIIIPYIPLTTRAYGLGICEIGETLQYEVNSKANQALDMVDFVLNPPMKKRRGADVADAVFAPGSVWEMDDIERDIAFVNIPNQLQSTLADRQDLRQSLYQRLGTSDYMRGMPGPDRVAQTIRMLLEQTSRRSLHQAKRFYEYFMRWYYRWVLALNLQFLADPADQTWESKMGTEYPSPFKIDPETQQPPTLKTLTRDLALPSSYLSGSKVLRTENFTMALKAIMENSMLAPQMDPQKVALEMLRMYDIPAPERLMFQTIPNEQAEIEDENNKLSLGQSIAPSFDDAHELHIQSHTELAAQIDEGIKAMPPELAKAVNDNIVAHVQAHMLLMDQAAQAQAAGPAAGGGPGPVGAGAAPPPPAPPAGPGRSPFKAQTMKVEQGGMGAA